MKILMISMFSNHFFNWTHQLKDTEHEVFWIDVFDSNTEVKRIDFTDQIIGWRHKVDYPGRYFIKSKYPALHKFINRFNQRDLAEVVEKKIKEIKPDVVHSFVMYSACVPILSVMNKNPGIKWIYSAWGNDLFHYKDVPLENKRMRQVFPRIDFMFADCERDYHIATVMGFMGKYLGTFPTGGGYDFSLYDNYVIPFSERGNKILIKGYEHKFGRCNNVLRALQQIRELLDDWEIIVFGANKKVMHFIKDTGMNAWKNLITYETIPHIKVLEFMGQSKIYIGNSISDGMPNTLLEAIIMMSFPIQSNPGGASSEIITNKKNGLLIEDPENSEQIASLISTALANEELMENGIRYNNEFIRPGLERKLVCSRVLEKYNIVQESLKGF